MVIFLRYISGDSPGYDNHLILLKIDEKFDECDFLCPAENT